jgi:hypothetical protein
MLLRLKPVLPIPKRLKIGHELEVVANPDVEVPDDIGAKMLKNDPAHWEKAVGKPDLSKYRRLDQPPAPQTPPAAPPVSGTAKAETTKPQTGEDEGPGKPALAGKAKSQKAPAATRKSQKAKEAAAATTG